MKLMKKKPGDPVVEIKTQDIINAGRKTTPILRKQMISANKKLSKVS